MHARLDVLCTGYAAERVASTVVLVRDGGTVIVADPGMVASRARILGPLGRLGVSPDEVTDVVFSHHHPDHTLNAALFRRARFHDFWAIYQDDAWTERPAEGFELSPSVRLMATPGHTAQDITTLVTTGDGLAACTHLWWSAAGPVVDPLAEDQKLLECSRARLLALEPAVIIPGHGTPFPPSELAPVVSLADAAPEREMAAWTVARSADPRSRLGPGQLPDAVPATVTNRGRPYRGTRDQITADLRRGRVVLELRRCRS